MQNATSLQINGTNFSKGNNSLNFGNQTSGQEQIFFCLKGVPQDITAQSYSSAFYGAWEIRILLVALIPAGRRRKKKKGRKLEDDRLVRALEIILNEIKEEYSLNKKELIEILVSKLEDRHKISKKEILGILKEEEINIPANIFLRKLGVLESLTKYMKENLNMNYKEISEKLNRDERTMWTAYKKATEKQKGPFKIKETGIMIPISIFKNAKLTTLEAIILYLKGKGLKFSEIAELLERDQRNIWTIYSRAKKKIIDGEQQYLKS